MKSIGLLLLVGLMGVPAWTAIGNEESEEAIRPPFRSFQCIARDSGWEEHRGGHRGNGLYQWQARQRALNHCQRFHGRCYITQCYRVH